MRTATASPTASATRQVEATDPADTTAHIRRTVYVLLTVVTVAAAAARVVGVELVYEPSLHRDETDTSSNAPTRVWPKNRPTPTPSFSSNDKSRWATIR